MKYDILIRNGHVIDPANKISDIRDIAAKDGKIALVAKGIAANEAEVCIDAAGLFVTPGIIDIHAHLYPMMPKPQNYVFWSVNPEAHMFQSGVTTAVDAGTVGWRRFLDFKQNIIDTCPVRILSFLNISDDGMIDNPAEQRPENLHPEITAAVAKAYPDTIVGIKSAHYRATAPFDDHYTPWASIDAAIIAGNLCQKPIMVDTYPNLPLRSYPDILKRLRPGDIHTHCFAPQFDIINDDGQISSHLREARQRGIRFDVGHGGGSYCHSHAARAYSVGWSPDTISSDLHMLNVHTVVESMQNVMSKFLNIGMPLEEVIRRSTTEPARSIGHPELGTLRVGACADVAVFNLRQGKFGFRDGAGSRLNGTRKLECVLTIRDGKIVYDTNALSRPEWDTLPPVDWRKYVKTFE